MADRASTTGLTPFKISDNSASLTVICLVAWLAPGEMGAGDLLTAFMLFPWVLAPSYLRRRRARRIDLTRREAMPTAPRSAAVPVGREVLTESARARCQSDPALGDAFELFLAAQLVVAMDGRAAHLAAHADRRAGRAMQEPPVVPQHHLARHPFVEIGALGPRDVRDDFAQEGVAFWVFHPLDAVRDPGRDVDHLAPGLF